MTMIEPNFFERHKKACIAAAIVILFFGTLAALWSWKGSPFVPEDSQEYKTLQGENNQLREENKGLRAETDAIKKERDGYQADLVKAGKLTADGIEKQKEATDNYAKDIATIGVDIPELDRCKRYCDSRANAGIPCRPDADAYCRLHGSGQ